MTHVPEIAVGVQDSVSQAL